MDALKRAGILALRVLGVLALAGALVAALFWLEKGGPVEPAEFVFAGTQDDADCAILLSRGACVVIDTGEEPDAGHILDLLAEKGVNRIDCLILTHPDKDHIGGAAQLLDALPVGLVMVPYYIEDNERYSVLQEKLTAMHASVLTLSRNREFTFGDLKVRVFPPEDFFYSTDNNYSLVTQVEHGAVRMLFAGDAQKDRLAELETNAWGKIDLYKVPHHGRNSTAGARFLTALAPTYAVVTAQAPEKEIAAALEEAGAQVFCTVPLQDTRFYSDGQTLSPAAP